MTTKDARLRLRELQKMIPSLENNYNSAQKQTSLEQKKLQEARNEILEIQKSLTSVNDDIAISDHAVLRYLEHKFNLDTKNIRDEILTKNVVEAIKSGANSIKINGLNFKINNKVITTVIK